MFTLAMLAAGALDSAAQEPADTARVEELDEVVVSGQGARSRIDDVRLGAEKLELGKLNSLPALFGERDIVKSVSLMPGVHSEGEGGGGFGVRGGNASQNLMLLDGMALYNPSHVLGIFSTFNSDALSRATLYKGPIPATYGEAISSVLDAGLSVGDMERYGGSATIGLLAAKLFVEGPVVKDKLSFALSARRSYLDMFLKMTDDYKDTRLNFYDITEKVRYRPTASDIVDLSFILTHDNMAVNGVMGMDWGNCAASLNWLHTLCSGPRFTTTASYTFFRPTMWMSVMDTDQRLRQHIRNANITEKMDYAVADNHNLQFGLRSEFLQVMSGEMVMNDSRLREVRNGWQNVVWTSYEGVFNDRWSTEAGVRFSFFEALKRHIYDCAPDDAEPELGNRLHFDTEFRLSLKYAFNDRHNVKFGIGDVTQNLHAIRSGSVSFPFDRYALTSATVEPERSLQFGLGYSGMTSSGDYDWSAELYHRELRNVYDYRDGVSMFSSINLESLILGGKGRSYGLELMVRKNSGRITGWISYTLSKTQTKIPGINDGRWYDSSNDRRHDFNVAAIYSFNPRWSMSASWVCSSGTPLTAPDAKYQLDGRTCYCYSQRNGYRTPATHHLDVSATYRKSGRHFTQEVTVGLYNLYNHYNPYVIYFEDDASKPSGTRAVQQSLYGIIPSVSYTLKF